MLMTYGKIIYLKLWPKLDEKLVNNVVTILQDIYKELIKDLSISNAQELLYNYLLIQDSTILPNSDRLKSIIGNNSPRIILLNYFNDVTLNPYNIDELVNRFIMEFNKERRV